MRFTELSTRTRHVKSPQRRLQEGQAIVLIALLILVLFGMLGLAIDSGRAYVDRRDQQAAVDAAALAAGDWFENFGSLYGSALPQSKQIFGGPANVTITATATAIVGNQRQTPALLTLSTDNCAMELKGGAQLTVLGNV